MGFFDPIAKAVKSAALGRASSGVNKIVDSVDDTLFKERKGVREAVTEAADFFTAGKTRNLRNREATRQLAGAGFSEEEIEARAEEATPGFVKNSEYLNLLRNDSVTERSDRIEALLATRRIKSGPLAADTGKGATILGGGMLIDPPEIPPAPTSLELSRQKTQEDVIREILEVKRKFNIPRRERTVIGQGLAGIASGLSYGVVKEKDDIFRKADLSDVPLSKAERVTGVTAEIGSSFVSYGLVAGLVGKGLRSYGALNSFARTNPYLFGAIVQNFGEEVVDATIRRGTGQEYGVGHFFAGMGLGGVADRLFRSVRGLKDVNLADVQKQMNTVAQGLQNSLGRPPTSDELFSQIGGMKIARSNVTYEEAYRESRLIYFRDKSNGDKPFIGERREIGLEGPRDIDTPELTGARTSIENTMDRSPEEVGIVFNSESTRQNIERGTRTWLDARFMESHRYFGPWGKKSANLIRQSDSRARRRLGDSMVEGGFREKLEILTKEEAINFSDAAEGLVKPMNDKVKALMPLWRNLHNDVATDAGDVGLKIAGKEGEIFDFPEAKEFYFPHKIDQKKMKEVKKSPQKMNKILDGMIEKSLKTERKLKNRAEARALLNKITSGAQPRYGNLERARQNLIPVEFLERDARLVIPEYLDSAYKRLEDARHFGPNGERFKEMETLIEEAGGDFQLYSEMIDRVTGKEALQGLLTGKGTFAPWKVKSSRMARDYQIYMKMGWSGLTNLNDLSKSAIITGGGGGGVNIFPMLRGTIKSIHEGFTQPSEFIRRSGILESNLKSMAEDFGDTKGVEKFLKAVQFERSEKLVRTNTANGVVNHAELMIKKLHKRMKAKGYIPKGAVGVEGRAKKFALGLWDDTVNNVSYRQLLRYMDDADGAIRRGSLSIKEKADIAERIVSETQPLSRLDMPHNTQTPTGRVMFQFKSFALKHVDVWRKHILSEAANGNLRPLIMFTVAAGTVGEGTADIRAFLFGRKRPEELGARIMDDLMQIGGLGLATDFLTSIMYGSQGSGGMRFFFGATISDMFEVTEHLLRPNYKGLVKKGMRSIPVVGAPLVGRVFPPKQRKPKGIGIFSEVSDLIFGEDEASKRPSSGRRKSSRKSGSRKPTSRRSSSRR